MITEEEKKNIVDFYKACDEMIEGRFILSDTKVSNILKAVVKSEILYDLYSVCMKDFKFDDVLARSIADNVSNGGYFSMSDDNKEIVAFVTCLLLEVDKQKINLQTFVTENFFSPDGYNISYNNFALTVLVVYKNAVKQLIGIDENGEVISDDNNFMNDQISMDEISEEVETDQDTKILFASLLMNIQNLQNSINDNSKIKYNEKEELLIVLKALNKAIHLEDLLIINALLVPLEHMLVKHKKLNKIYDNIKLLIADIYY